MLCQVFCDYSDAFILVAGYITVNTEDNDGNNRVLYLKIVHYFLHA